MTNELKELRRAKRIVRKFCNINNITTPSTYVSNLKGLGNFKLSTNKIYIDIKKCKLSNKYFNSAYINDATITGTVLHEVAHYIHLNFFKEELRTKFKRTKEPLIHYYERDINEDIAESIRLFITNPSLLMDGRPKRYKIISSLLKPLKQPHFTQLFSTLPIEHKRMVNRWIDNNI